VTTTRRQSGLALLALAAAPLLAPGFAFAAGAKHPAAADDDDDDDLVVNVFISPCGEPFRARKSEPYAVAAWFHKADANGDGKLDHDEFIADAAAFFKTLDRNGDGILSRYEILLYERNIAPEILGGRVKVSLRDGAKLWLAQMPGGMGGMGGPAVGSVDPGGDHPDASAPPRPDRLDESGQGAAPFSLFEEPEPVLTADLNVDGIIRRDNFLKVADMHFTALDVDKVGYLTLAGLPKTPMQKLLEHTHHGRRRS